MNYVPGTASLIDDIDSKSEGRGFSERVASRCGIVSETNWIICNRLICYLTCLCRVRPTEKHLVLLRDGRTLIGYLRSIDQFGTHHLIISHLLLS